MGLELDVSEIFKPLLVDRLIFTLVNKKMLGEKDFVRDEDGAVAMTKEARKGILQLWDERLDKTIENPETGSRSSWRRLVLTEVRKVQAHILGGLPYAPFKYRW